MYSPVYIDVENIYIAYKTLFSHFDMNTLHKYQRFSALIHLKDVINYGMPSKINSVHNLIYQDFITTKLDDRWVYRKDWYLSYARRLTISDDGESQMEFAVRCLSQDKESRRCCLFTHNPLIDSSDYRPALTSIWFCINDDRLNMQVNWRSKEFLVSFPMCTMAMLSFMRFLYNRLLTRYKNLILGEYSEFINELHLYPMKNVLNIDNYEFGVDIDAYSAEYVHFLWSLIINEEEHKYDANYRNTGQNMAMQNLW